MLPGSLLPPSPALTLHPTALTHARAAHSLPLPVPHVCASRSLARSLSHSRSLPGALAAEDLTASPDTREPLYYWQVYSLLGPDPLVAIVRRFYEFVFDDDEDPAFKEVRRGCRWCWLLCE